MRARTQRYATFLLAVFTVGALVLPLAHEFTHVRSLDHRRDNSAMAVSGSNVDRAGTDDLDFLIDTPDVRHNPDCDLCARLTLDAAQRDYPADPFLHVEGPFVAGVTSLANRALTSSQIRAPPFAS